MVDSTSKTIAILGKNVEKYHLHLVPFTDCWVHVFFSLGMPLMALPMAPISLDSWCDHCKRLDELDVFWWNVGCLEVFLWGLGLFGDSEFLFKTPVSKQLDRGHVRLYWINQRTKECEDIKAYNSKLQNNMFNVQSCLKIFAFSHSCWSTWTSPCWWCVEKVMIKYDKLLNHSISIHYSRCFKCKTTVLQLLDGPCMGFA